MHENWYDRNTRSDSAISPTPTPIFPDLLYLSSAPTAANLAHLLTTRITHIINLSSCSDYWSSQDQLNAEWSRLRSTDRRLYASLVKRYGREAAENQKLPFGYPPPKYLHIEIEDTEDALLAPYFPHCIAYIHETRQRDPTARFLVHCYQGRSRSASVVIAYVMWAAAVGFDDALAFVKSRRSAVAPNKGFVAQLRAFEAVLFSPRTENDDDESGEKRRIKAVGDTYGVVFHYPVAAIGWRVVWWWALSTVLFLCIILLFAISSLYNTPASSFLHFTSPSSLVPLLSPLFPL